uniref:DUF1640 domain-containing protein n=1 Tax=Candidatus Kentrum sp. UNK TaxID=2126344 RepID=A0A451AGW9_9GAMM|nr:MAG: Protein of unknown function (DUF1640) [Candidatus Kentron sp. UNK]VFK71430.1 MAG: Protein of unknown function (DUF1640) [Candidatus Kentron sp. UNK]
MTAVTFDTLKFVHRLKDSGIPNQQAEAISEALKEAHENTELVTKEFLELRLAELKNELLKWLIGLTSAQIVLLLGILVKIS